MPRYNEFRIVHDGVQYVFVTRGRSKEFTPEEALKYLVEYSTSDDAIVASPAFKVDESVKAEIYDGGQDAWQIPDTRQRRHMFRQDLQKGMPYCIDKYGQPQEVLEAEARRLALGGF
jgi:hypothetical protein